jgi:hypothetical protein
MIFITCILLIAYAAIAVMRHSTEAWSQPVPVGEAMASEEFRVIVRDQVFVLDKHQILFDSPNYFSSYFLGEFKEAAEGQRQLTLRRDPFLFRIIENYLSGYSVLPLPPNLPPHLSKETAMANLLRDAQFYGIDGLVTLLEPGPLAVETEYNIYVGLHLRSSFILL